MERAVILEGARTPIGRFLGSFAEITNVELGTPAPPEGMRLGYGMGDATVYDGMYRDGLLDPLCGLIMGETAENLVDMYNISRQEQDEFALESQHKAEASKAIRAAETFPVEASDPNGRGTITVTEDEHARPETTLEGLAKLKPVFRENG